MLHFALVETAKSNLSTKSGQITFMSYGSYMTEKFNMIIMKPNSIISIVSKGVIYKLKALECHLKVP